VSAPVVMRIAPAGDAALRVELEDRLDPDINTAVIALAEGIRQQHGAAVLDVVTGYSTVTVYFDPLGVAASWLEQEMRAIADAVRPAPRESGRLIEVPVCYGGEFGPDLDDVAAFGACSRDDVVELHARGDYRVYMVGFVPGFAYLGIVDARIAAPRRATPRPAVPSGSVAIAGGQTGIYPSTTPGGWNIIGRTPLRPYDPARPEPFLFRAGDRVRFAPVSPDRLADAV
jgi:inhibitor of KinA